MIIRILKLVGVEMEEELMSSTGWLKVKSGLGMATKAYYAQSLGREKMCACVRWEREFFLGQRGWPS